MLRCGCVELLLANVVTSFEAFYQTLCKLGAVLGRKVRNTKKMMVFHWVAQWIVLLPHSKKVHVRFQASLHVLPMLVWVFLPHRQKHDIAYRCSFPDFALKHVTVQQLVLVPGRHTPAPPLLLGKKLGKKLVL